MTEMIELVITYKFKTMNLTAKQKECLEMYYPKGDEDFSVLRFIPDKMKTYSNFQTITEEV